MLICNLLNYNVLRIVHDFVAFSIVFLLFVFISLFCGILEKHDDTFLLVFVIF